MLYTCIHGLTAIMPPGLTILLPRVNYLTKAPVPGMRNPQLKLLVRVIQVTPKTMKAIDIALGHLSKVEDKSLG